MSGAVGAVAPKFSVTEDANTSARARPVGSTSVEDERALAHTNGDRRRVESRRDSDASEGPSGRLKLQWIAVTTRNPDTVRCRTRPGQLDVAASTETRPDHLYLVASGFERPQSRADAGLQSERKVSQVMGVQPKPPQTVPEREGRHGRAAGQAGDDEPRARRAHRSHRPHVRVTASELESISFACNSNREESTKLPSSRSGRQ